MKVNFYLDKPYNPDISPEKVKQELAKVGGKKKNLAQKFWNPSPHNSEPQNLIIANVLYKSEVLESWGRGIGLMISECRRVGIPDPEFHTDGNSVWVIFRYTRKTVGHDPTITRQLPHSHPTVTPQVEKVLSAIGTQTLSTKEIMCVIGLKDKSNFLELYLYPAIRQNLVEPIYPENPKHPRQKYRLTDKGKELLI